MRFFMNGIMKSVKEMSKKIIEKANVEFPTNKRAFWTCQFDKFEPIDSNLRNFTKLLFLLVIHLEFSSA